MTKYTDTQNKDLFEAAVEISVISCELVVPDCQPVIWNH